MKKILITGADGTIGSVLKKGLSNDYEVTSVDIKGSSDILKIDLTDYEALKEVVGKDYKYLGLIGSKRKINTLMTDALKDGLNVKDNDRLFTPIGLDIAKNDPAEIALSIMAEILLIKNGGSLKHLNMKR